MAFTMFSHMGWVVFSAVADDATHCYPHCLFVKCHWTFCTLGVTEGDRGGLAAGAGDVDLRGSGGIGVVSVVSSSYAIGFQMGQKKDIIAIFIIAIITTIIAIVGITIIIIIVVIMIIIIYS